MLTERPVTFSSEGATLRGLLVTESIRSSRRPLVVMAHGTSATIQMVAIEYARVFASVGLAVLIYDHRNFGRSDGQPRLQINPWVQCRGYRDAMNYALGLPEIDADRVALWGDSYTGGQVVVVSACDSRVKAIVAQCPVIGPSVPDTLPSEEAMGQIRRTLESGDVSGPSEATAGPLPVVSPSQLAFQSLLTPIQAYRWFIDYGGRPASGWINEVSRVIPRTSVTYSPYLCAPFIRAKALFMVAPDDEMVHANYNVTRKAFDLVQTQKEWYDIRDGHFGLLYYPSERFDEASRVQAGYLQKQLDA